MPQNENLIQIDLTDARSVLQVYSDAWSEMKELYAQVQTSEDRENAFHTEKTHLGNSNYTNDVITQMFNKM